MGLILIRLVTVRNERRTFLALPPMPWCFMAMEPWHSARQVETKTWRLSSGQRSALALLSVVRQLWVIVPMPSLQKCAVGPLVRLEISPILYALVGRPEVLAATCGRTHSSGNVRCPANLYINAARRSAVSADAEKVSRRAEKLRTLSPVFTSQVSAVITVMSLPLRRLRTTLWHRGISLSGSP